MTRGEGAWFGSVQGERSVSQWFALAGLACVLGALGLVLTTPPASGYERSIYGAYPRVFWVLVVAALFLGQLVVLRAALDRYPETASWRVGVLLIAVVQAILVFVPYLRGYPLYGAADVLTHVGYVRTLEASGGTMFLNVYQNIHQLVLALSYATGVESIHVINAVAGVVSLFVLVAALALLSALFDRRRALMTIPFVIVLLGGQSHLNPSPFSQSILLVPFVLYLFVRAQQTEAFAFRAVLAVAVVGLVTYHPLTGLFMILVFGVHAAVVFATRLAGDEYSVGVSPVSSRLVMQLSLVTFVAWYYNYVGMFIRFRFVIDSLTGASGGASELDQYSATVTQYTPSLVDLAAIGAAKYGQSAVYLAIGTALVVGLAWLLVRRRRVGSPYLLTFGTGFCVFLVLTLVFLTVNLIGGFGRPLVFAQLFAAISAGSVFSLAYVDVGWRRATTAVAVVALAALVVFSVVGLYPSGVTGRSNLQVTERNLDGASWYLDNAEEETPLRQMGISLFRFEDAINGTRSRALPADSGSPPDHFNYTNHPTVGAGAGETQYLVVTERARVFYPTTYPDYRAFWGFEPADWARLERDPTVSHVYGNGEFDVYVVQPPDAQ